MKNFQILLLLVAVLCVWSCDTDPPELDDPGTLALSFEATFDGATLMGGTDYVLPDGKKARFSQFNFFVSDVTVNQVEDGNSNIVDLSEVEFVELTQTPSSPLEATDHIFGFFNMATGSYSGLDFTLGLGETLNNKTPSDQDLGENSPLRTFSHHWSSWGSYIFLKLEGWIDFNEDGVLADDEKIVYHTGSENDNIGDDSNAEQSVNLPISFDINSNETTTINLGLDVRDILYNATGEPNWDIENKKNISSLDDFDLILEIMGKAADTFEIGQ